MTVFQFCICAGLVFLILELFAPMTFFLSFAVGAFITAIFSIWFVSKTILIPIFAVCSILSLLIFKPFLAINTKTKKEQETGINSQYIGKIAKVIKKINTNEGAISIYGERWEARSTQENDEFPEGSEVCIVKNNSLIMYVKQCKKGEIY